MNSILALAALLILAALPADAHKRAVTTHTLIAKITGYVWTGYRTASGRWPVVGVTVATDPAVIPLGSHLRISGLPGVREAQDTGGFSGAWIDVFVSSTAQAFAITSYRRVTWWR